MRGSNQKENYFCLAMFSLFWRVKRGDFFCLFFKYFKAYILNFILLHVCHLHWLGTQTHYPYGPSLQKAWADTLLFNSFNSICQLWEHVSKLVQIWFMFAWIQNSIGFCPFFKSYCLVHGAPCRCTQLWGSDCCSQLPWAWLRCLYSPLVPKLIHSQLMA